jgi:hypothetical protein
MKKLLLTILLIGSLTLLSNAQGKLEVGVHYSSWGSGLVIAYPEDNITDAFNAYGGPIELDPHGHNYGFELRFFPGGKQGSFSIGISYERNYFKADLSGSYTETIAGGTVTKTGNGKIDLTPHSFNMDLRWEIIPHSKVHPYLGIGFGVGPLNGNVTLTTITKTEMNGSSTTQTETERLTLKEAIENIEAKQGKDLYFLNFFPIVHLNLGLRAEVTENIYLLGEVALYDGIIARGGLAYRF